MAVGLEDRLAPAPVQGVIVRQPLQRIALRISSVRPID
jgi:hypothetical protein